MAFFETLGETLANKGKEAAEAAKKMAEIANIKGQITAINTEIKKNYARIGEEYYNAHKDSEISCEFEEYVQSVRDAERAIKELEKKIGELKGTVKCQECGSEIASQSVFCPKCGTKVEAEYFDEEDEEGISDEVVIQEADICTDTRDEIEETVVTSSVTDERVAGDTSAVGNDVMPEKAGSFDVTV